MTPPDPSGIPAWEWLLGLFVIVGVPALCGVAVALVQRPVRAYAKAAAADAAITREHTENSHADAEHPNMRDELTATLEAARDGARAAAEAADLARQALGGVGSLRRELEQQRREVEGVRDDVRAAATAATAAAAEGRALERAVHDLGGTLEQHLTESAPLMVWARTQHQNA